MIDSFVRFLARSPTVYQASREIGVRFAEEDFTPLSEKENWKLEAGKSYFFTRDDTLLVAFRIPKKKPKNAIILASHTDSPALKLKPQPELSSQNIGLLGTENYGGPLLHTWLDRDLAIAGRIVVLNKQGKCETHTVFLDDYPVIIPNLALHLHRDMNDKGLILNKQDHLRAVFSIHKKHTLEDLLKKHHPFQKLLGFDLLLVPTEKPGFNGFEDELISAYRIDNLTSAFASMEALIQTKASKDSLQMAIFWDHEEIGSKTFVGADSIFLNDLLKRICLSFQMEEEDFYKMKAASFCISCDVTHGYHPNYAEKHDAQNTPLLGKGAVLKFSPRYATNGSTSAQIVALAEKNKIPLQVYAPRSDTPSGATVGAMMAANAGIRTVDLGIGCWGMHSIRETMAAQDLTNLTKLLKCALESPILETDESF